MTKLDLKDRKLLYEIDFDARKTYAELTKAISMSKRGIGYKLESLEKQGIILGYIPIIDMTSFGYDYFRVFIDLQNLDKKLKQQVEEYIKRDPNIGWAIWTYGPYRIGFTIWAKSVTDFKKTINNFYSKFGKHIHERTESIATEVHFFKNRYLLDTGDNEKIVIKEKEVVKKYDALDLKILRELIKNPRTKIVDLAQKVKETVKKVNYRLKQLQERKILLAIRPIINHQKLGKTYYKLFIDLNRADDEQIKKLEKYLTENKKTTYIVRAMGTCDIDIELMVNSAEELFQFISNLQEKFPGTIKNYKTLILTETMKAHFLPPKL